MKIKQIAKRVESLLRRSKACRDSDQRVIASIWRTELEASGYDIHEISGFRLLEIMVEESILPSHESIRRARQKLQEKYPELRGESYKARVEKLEPETRKEIREWDKPSLKI